MVIFYVQKSKVTAKKFYESKLREFWINFDIFEMPVGGLSENNFLINKLFGGLSSQNNEGIFLFSAQHFFTVKIL